MRFLCFCGLFLVLAGRGRADDDPKRYPVSIKVVQTAEDQGNTFQIKVTNTSMQPVIVDREALQQPDFTVSKDVTAKDSEDIRELVTGTARGSVGGRWTLAQLQRREPKRLATILPRETFTIDVEIAKLLGSAHESFRHGDIKVKCSFHDFLLAVDGKDTTEDMFKARVEAEQSTIYWR